MSQLSPGTKKAEMTPKVRAPVLPEVEAPKVMSEWKLYRKQQGGVQVEARIVQIGDEKAMEVRIPGRSKGVCPNCQIKVSSDGTFFRVPEVFHRDHRPYKKPAPKED